jgi:hypothetical protein
MSRSRNHRPGFKADELLPAELRLRSYVAKQQLIALKKLAALANHSAGETRTGNPTPARRI